MKKLMTILLSALMGIAAYTVTFAQLSTSGLLASYPFNGNANDESGNNYNGLVNGATLTTDRFGNANSAYSFNGVSNYINLGSQIGNFGTSDFTISVFVKVGNPQNDIAAIIGKRGTGGYGNFWDLQIANADVTNGLSTFEVSQYTNTTNYIAIRNGNYIYDNSWHHCVATRNGSNLKIYIDGVLNTINLVNSTGVADINNTFNTIIGAVGNSSSSLIHFIKGNIDDILIYNRALTTGEISYLYTGPTTPTWISTPATSICTQSITYQVNAVTNATQYVWMIDGIAVQTSSSTQYTKTWASSDAGNHTVSVIAKDAFGGQSTALVSSPITVYILLSAPAAIGGNNTVCLGSTAITSTYSVAAVTSAQSYIWKLNGVTIPSITSNTASITFSTAGNAQSISVQAVNVCGSSPAKTLSVDVKSIPVVPTQIISEATYCYNSKANILTSPVPGATSYEWKVNSAIRPETGLYIGADFSAAGSGFIVGSNNISIAALNGTCKSAPYIASVTLNSVPTGVTIDGPTSICPFTYANYSVSPGNAQLGYFWKINSSDPTVNYQNNANALRVNFPYSPGSSYDIKVTASNSCGNTEITKTVTLNSNVPPIPTISCSTKVSGVCQLLKTTFNQYATQTKWYIDGVYKPALDGSITLDLTNVAYQGVQYQVSESNGTCSYSGYFGECQNVVQGQSARMAAEEIASPQSTVTVYPNPNSGSFIIETDGAAGTAYIINTSGQLVETVTLEKGVSVTSVKLSSAGLYVVKVKTESANKSFKVSVE